MRALVVLLLAGCAANTPAGNVLCWACTSDADCFGNPCFADFSGQRYCGRPCDSGCPAGFSCQPVAGSMGQVAQTCFPDSELCMMQEPPGADLAGVDFSLPANPTHDLAVAPGRDLATVPCTPPSSAGVTVSGGTVDRLYFGYTGDTRPMASSSSYSSSLQTTINGIYTRMGKDGVQFALDGGDHMEASSAGDAQGNMASYVTAAKLLGKPLFMTMGNHECQTSFTNDCGYAGAATSDYKMAAFMNSLQSLSGQTAPYYRVDITTQSGKAVFLVVADDAWNATQQSWLTQQLTDADAHARYTFVSKHHPDGNTDQASFQMIYDLVTTHKYTLFLTGHSHEYKHQISDRRAVVMGLGGAPFDNPNQMWNGYLRVMQCPDDSVSVSAVDASNGNIMDSFTVPPQ